jgi:integrase
MQIRASAALNKWLKNVIGKEYTVHGFRHSFRDRLRAVECPSEIIDQLGGNGILMVLGINTGRGFPDEILIKWMKKLE